MRSVNNKFRYNYRTHHLSVYLLFALLITLNLWRAAPFYNLDLVGYVGVVQSFYGGTPEEIHTATYAQIEHNTPPSKFKKLIGENPTYSVASEYAKNSDYFHNLLPGYFVKPLYPSLMFVADVLGYNAVKASILISKLSYLGIALFLLIWISRIFPTHLAAVIAGLILTLPISLNLARFSTPDALSVLLYVLTAYLVTEKPYPIGVMVIGVLSIMVRPDNIIFFTLLSLWLLIRNRDRYIAIGVMATIGISVYYIQSVWSESWGWSLLFYRSFIDHSPIPPAEVSISILDYLNVLQSQLMGAVKKGDYIFLFLILNAGLVWKRRHQAKMWDNYSILITLNLANILAHIILFPREMDRILAGMYIVTLIVLLKNYSENKADFKAVPET